MATVEPGAIIGGRYQVERTIGTGGMAKVWLAHDRLLDRRVAVKILAEPYASDPDFVERFRREASAAAGLSHPNIVTVYDRGETDGSYYIVMEYLPGPDLKAIIRQRGRLDARQAVDAALQVLAALSAAHRRDVVHRDIKPQNVLIADDGHLKVTDFGIARAGDDSGVTEVGSVMGTAQYLSPEQARGEEVTSASDCYSVGILLYEMLTGRVPFDGDKPVAIAMRQVNDVPVQPRVIVPQIPPQLNEVVMKALEKRPAGRYRTAEEFTAALLAVRPTLPEPVEDATQVLAAVESPATTRIIPAAEPPRIPTGRTHLPPPPPPKRRRRGGLITAIVFLILAAGAAIFLLTDLGRSDTVKVPGVAGLPEATARSTLQDAGFRVIVNQQTSAEVADGSVIGTDPPEGSDVAKGSVVKLRVSSGGELAVVPDVIGQAYEDAAATLTRLKFQVKRQDGFSDRPAGEVFDQEPVGNAEAHQGDEVTLFVSKGQEMVEVPALKLKSQSDARRALESAGFKLGTVTERESSSRPAGTVLDQDPTAGTKAPKGSKVNIVVATAPAVQTVPMPDVVGNSANAARQKLIGLGFADPIATTVPSNQAAGTVLDQSPSAGKQVDPAKTHVVLTVSGGPTQVPTAPSTGTTTATTTTTQSPGSR